MTETIDITTSVSRNGTAPMEMVHRINVTPVLAAKWLARNIHNRPLRERFAQAYAQDMLNGDWTWTADPIRFAGDIDSGPLVDGQHRLRGVVIAGETNPDVSIPMLVVFGLEERAQEDIDRGLPRKFHDVLHLRGEHNASALAALIRRVHNWTQGNRRIQDTKFPYTSAQLLRTLDEHPELREMVVSARRVSESCAMPASIIGLAWWVCAEIDEGDANYFFERLGDGQALAKTDPVYELRRAVAATKTIRGARNMTYLLAITIKAWNAFRAGQPIGQLRWAAGGAKPEAFPEPQ